MKDLYLQHSLLARGLPPIVVEQLDEWEFYEVVNIGWIFLDWDLDYYFGIALATKDSIHSTYGSGDCDDRRSHMAVEIELLVNGDTIGQQV